MTYKEYYMTLKTEDEVMKEAEKDVNIAVFMMGNNPDRVEKIKKATQEVLSEKFSV